MALVQRIARRAAVAALALSLAQPVVGQDATGLPGEGRERDMRGLVLGLAALAAIGLVLHEREEDREEEARRLPSRCLATWPVSGGEVVLYDSDCLDERFEAAERLPLSCAVTVRSRGRFVSGFDPACLREEGWRTRE